LRAPLIARAPRRTSAVLDRIPNLRVMRVSPYQFPTVRYGRCLCWVDTWNPSYLATPCRRPRQTRTCSQSTWLDLQSRGQQTSTKAQAVRVFAIPVSSLVLEKSV